MSDDDRSAKDVRQDWEFWICEAMRFYGLQYTELCAMSEVWLKRLIENSNRIAAREEYNYAVMFQQSTSPKPGGILRELKRRMSRQIKHPEMTVDEIKEKVLRDRAEGKDTKDKESLAKLEAWFGKVPRRVFVTMPDGTKKWKNDLTDEDRKALKEYKEKKAKE